MTKNKTFSLAMFLIFLSASAFGQVNRYMVFFKDKNGTPYSASQPGQFLSEKAIERRVEQGIAVSDQDLPVNPAYAQGVSLTGAKVFFTTRWMNGVLVQCESSVIPSVQALPFVSHVEFVAPQQRLTNGGRRKSLFRKKNFNTGVRTQTQLQMLGIPQMHADGFQGEGITIALLDGGFIGVNTTAPFQEVFSEGRYDDVVSHDFVRNTDNVFQYDDHGTQVFSVIAANVADDFTGGAPKATFQLFVTEDEGSEYRIEEYNWLFAAERADSAGVDIISSSLGYYDFDLASMNYTTGQMDGNTAVVTKAAQWAADRGIIVVTSAGNEGNLAWRIITAPADAVDVVAVANVNGQGAVSSSSSRGPSSDGRIKPDLAALGSGVTVIQSNGNIGTASGTSLAAPLITSLIAGVWQKFPEFSAKEIVAALKKTASRSGNPDNNVGYGIPSYLTVSEYLDRENTGDAVFEVYPNPAFDSLTISPADPDAIPTCTIELVSRLGQVLATEEVSFSWTNNTYRTDISSLASGIYFVRLNTADKKYVFRIIKTP
jgi:serine protease AprX